MAYSATAARNIRPENDLHSLPLGATVGYNPIVGTVTYSYSYNDRLDFLDTDALSETISVTKNSRPDLYASITILDRGAVGPLLQSLGTSGPETHDVSVDVLYVPYPASTTAKPTSWGDVYDTLFTVPTNGFTISETETWDARNGHYTKSKSWEIGEC